MSKYEVIIVLIIILGGYAILAFVKLSAENDSRIDDIVYLAVATILSGIYHKKKDLDK